MDHADLHLFWTRRTRLRRDPFIRDDDPDGAYLRVRTQLEPGELRRLHARLADAEPALLSLVLPARATRFVGPRALEPELRTADAWRARFAQPSPELAVDPHGVLTGGGTLEVRLLDTGAGRDALRAWAGLWTLLVAATSEDARAGRRRPATLLCSGPRGDVVDLVRRLGGDVELARALAARRTEVAPAWERAGAPWDAIHRRARAGWWSP